MYFSQCDVFFFLQCTVEAFPEAVNYWERHDGRLIQNTEKYTLTSTFDGYKTDLSLNVSLNDPSDFGTYYCISKNPKGLTKAAMELFGKSFFQVNAIGKVFLGHKTPYIYLYIVLAGVIFRLGISYAQYSNSKINPRTLYFNMLKHCLNNILICIISKNTSFAENIYKKMLSLVEIFIKN